MIKTGNKEPSKSSSWKVLETVMSHLKDVVFLNTDSITHLPVFLKIINISCVVMIEDTYRMTVRASVYIMEI